MRITLNTMISVLKIKSHDTMFKIMLAVFLLMLIFYHSESDRAPTWDSCGCSWMSWEAWSQCSVSCGGGYRHRIRKVRHYKQRPGCEPFEACASNDMGYDYDRSCNAICYHGTYSGGSCRCQTGWYGRCCSSRMYKILILYKLSYQNQKTFLILIEKKITISLKIML